jgi:hypothetical protein
LEGSGVAIKHQLARHDQGPPVARMTKSISKDIPSSKQRDKKAEKQMATTDGQMGNKNTSNYLERTDPAVENKK